MRYIPDTTGRFGQRPYYSAEELDNECDDIIRSFLRDRCGGIAFPISTDILTKLIERDAEDLDTYANLTGEGDGVEGVTEFFPGCRPCVRIASHLSEHPSAEHRLRTTLAHEYGHVHFHRSLWDAQAQRLPLFPNQQDKQDLPAPSARCHRATILTAPRVDWMEWQAGYVCGALLMPITALKKFAADDAIRRNRFGPVARTTSAAHSLVARVAETFNVSSEAARIRLEQTGLLVDSVSGISLFP